MKKWYETFVQNTGGFLKPAVGASVSVYNTGTSVLAVIYEDDGVTTKTNPTTTDADGYVEFKVADGIYDIVASKNNVELKRLDDVDISESGGGSYDPANVAITGGTITGVTIDNSPIGQTVPALGNFAEGGT